MRAGVWALAAMIVTGTVRSSAARAAPFEWVLARSPHFELYSQAAPEHARALVAHFEELRSFVDRNQLVQSTSVLNNRPPVRVIEFGSRKEYESFKIRPAADAYYTGTADRDYIVMPGLTAGEFGVAAHEYAHSVLYSRGLKLPAWLNEGIAELFSTVTITGRHCEFGGPLRGRIDALHHSPWLSAGELLAAEPNSPLRESRSGSAIFYAESWALTDMLSSSPEYAPRFGDLIGMLNSDPHASQQAFMQLYGRTLDTVIKEAKDWIDQAKSSRRALPSLAPDSFPVATTRVTEPQAAAITADLLFANGQWARSEQIYKQLLSHSPRDPELLASLGTVALRQGNPHEAADYLRQALDDNLQDSSLSYRYALLADDLNLPSREIARALENAIAIQPTFDDARYKLALLKGNAGEYEAAVIQLQAMAQPSGKRAFGYWTALANALSELDRRGEAESAANQAMQVAATPDERAKAAELAYTARTDLTVRFARDAHGDLQLTTTRVPHGATDFNPFVEPSDQIQVTTGKLKEVQCSEGRLTGLLIESKAGSLTLSIPDPLHVLIRNGPSQFYCGPQLERSVKVEYATAANAAAGLLRGMDFQ